MPSWRELFPDKWLKADVIGTAHPRVTIESVHTENLFNPATKKSEIKLIAKFRGKDLQLILNKTAATTLAAISGSDDYESWRDLNIILSVAKAQNGKDTIIITPASGAASGPTARPAERRLEEAQAGGNFRFEEETFERPRPSAPAPEEDKDFDDLWEAEAARPAPPATRSDPAARSAPPADTAARIDKSGARLINNSNGPCPECHAPVDKLHASGCTAVGTVAAARIDNSTARPQAPTTRPVAQVSLPLNAEEQLYADLATLYDSGLPLEQHTMDLIRKARNANLDSTARITDAYFTALRALLQENLATAGDEEAYMLLTALLGYRVSAKIKPGQLVHGYIVKPLREGNDKFVESLMEILTICRELAEINSEEDGSNG